MGDEWGIFSDESADYTAPEAVEAGFYSKAEAEKRLAEIRKENGDDDDNCTVHKVEEPDADEFEIDEEGEFDAGFDDEDEEESFA